MIENYSGGNSHVVRVAEAEDGNLYYVISELKQLLAHAFALVAEDENSW